LFYFTTVQFLHVQRVHEKTAPKYNGVVFKILGKHQWNFYNWI